MKNTIDHNHDLAPVAQPDGACANEHSAMLEITHGEIFATPERSLFADDTCQQLMIKGHAGEKITLSDLLPAGAETGEWTKASGSVTVDGVQYDVYQHSGMPSELLVQTGMLIDL